MTSSGSGFAARVTSRLSASLLGAALAGGIVAFVDAAYAAGGLPPLRWVAAELGLVAPLAFGLGLVTGLAAVLLLPSDWPRPGRLLSSVRELSPAERRELSLRIVLVTGATLLGLVLVSRVALRLLANPESAAASGASLGLASVALTAVLATLSLGGARVADRLPERWAPNPLAVAAGALAFALAAFALLVLFGTTSGAGGPLAVFGVFRREELDLRAATLVAVIIAGALAVPSLASWVTRGAALVVALFSFAATPFAAGSAFDRQTSLAVERAAPLGKLLLASARSMTDRDRDGASGRFGGGDCAEGNAAIGPAAEDAPGNGIDEDCSGSDAAPPASAPAAAERPVAASEWIRSRLPSQPNVILITIDALRAELGYSGYPRKISPNIDALAAKSAVFERAYALASYTSKSLGPMLIGRYGSETRRGFLHFNRFPKEETFLSERLQRAGIRTVSVQGHWYFFKPYGFERGYDVLDTEATPADQPIEGDRSTNGDVQSDRLIQQLERPELESQRFFLWTHYIDPHAEYVPHEGFDFGARGRDRYDGEIAFVDHHLGRVLDALAKRPFANRTIIILTSDHGEAFGEHGLYRHGFEVWEELVRVPLLIHVPGAEPRRIAVPRSTIDIVPTVLESYGIEPPAAGARDALRGESLLPDVLVPPGYEPRARVIYVDMPYGPYNDERQAYIENDMKLVTSGGRPLGLFDLAKDPGERRDLADDPALVKPLLEKTKAFRRSLDEIVERKP